MLYSNDNIGQLLRRSKIVVKRDGEVYLQFDYDQLRAAIRKMRDRYEAAYKRVEQENIGLKEKLKKYEPEI